MYLPGTDVYDLRGRTLMVTARGGIGYAALPGRPIQHGGSAASGGCECGGSGMGGCVECYGLCPVPKQEPNGGGMGQLEFLPSIPWWGWAAGGLLALWLLKPGGREYRMEKAKLRQKYREEKRQLRAKYRPVRRAARAAGRGVSAARGRMAAAVAG